MGARVRVPQHLRLAEGLPIYGSVSLSGDCCGAQSRAPKLEDGSNKLTTVNLSDAQRETIDQKLKADGFGNFVNLGVVQLSTNEAKSRPVFEFAKKWGINILAPLAQFQSGNRPVREVL